MIQDDKNFEHQFLLLLHEPDTLHTSAPPFRSPFQYPIESEQPPLCVQSLGDTLCIHTVARECPIVDAWLLSTTT